MTQRSIFSNLICVFTLLIALVSGVFCALSKKQPVDFSFDANSIYNWSDDWEVSYGNTKLEGQTLPMEVPAEQGKSVLLKKKLPATIKKYNSVLITGVRQDIIVSVGGILRESYSDKESRRFGKSSPSAYLVVPIYSTDADADITVRLSSDSRYSGTINEVILGNEMSIILMLIKSNVVWVLLSLLLFMIGIATMISFFAYRLDFEMGKSYIYISLYAILSAIWYFSTLTVRQFVIGNLAGIETFGYLLYMMSAIPFVLFFESITNDSSKTEFVIVLVTIFLNLFGQIALFIAGYFELHEMSFVTHALCAVIAVCMSVDYINNCEKNKKSTSKLILTGILIFITWFIMAVVSYALKLEIVLYQLFVIPAIIFASANMSYIQKCISKEQRDRKDAESASKAKSIFLANMSHEIRTPINAVLGMNELILRDSKEENIRGYSVNIADAGKSLLALVNDILDFSKIESGKMDIIPTEYKMKVLLNDLILMTESRMSGKDLKLKLEIDENIPSVYYGDEVRIRQVVTNILTNAVKYTKQGTVTFNVSIIENKDDYATIRFSVKDTGKGIKKEDLDVLLSSSFNRVNDEENRTIEGTGLGLAITRQLLELMGSELEVESEYGSGSTFAFNIKQKIIDSSKMGSVNEKEKRTHKRKNTFTAPNAKLLVVDDVKMNIMVLLGLLKPYGIKPKTCESGEQCVEICKEEQFDLILLDHMMPGLDGIETFKKLKSDNIISDKTKVIVLTANAVMGASEIYLESGFDAYMTKPVDPTELDNMLKKFLGDFVVPLDEDK